MNSHRGSRGRSARTLWARSESVKRSRRAIARLAIEALEPRELLSGNPPVAANDVFNTPPGVDLISSAPGVLANDTDAENDALTAVLVSTTTHGTLNLNSDGSFTYSPAGGFIGTDSFTYKDNDGTQDGNVATATITVDNAPLSADDTYTIPAGQSLIPPVAQGVLANDFDADGDTLTALVVAQPAHGSLTLNTDGSFTYTPAAGFTGSDGFTYKANDGLLDGNVAQVSVTVTNPVTANDDSQFVYGGNTLTLVASSGVLSNDSDANNLALTASVGQTTAHGVLTLNSDGSLTYVPSAGFTGTDSFTYTASDGTFTSDPATVQITVGNPIFAFDNSYGTPANKALSVDATNGLLSSDFDVNGNALTAAVGTLPANGTVTVNADGSFTYTPNTNFVGDDSFTYTATDGKFTSDPATVQVTVQNPVGTVDDFYSTFADQVLTVDPAHGVLANDTHGTGTSLAAAIQDQPTNGTVTLHADGSFVYTPNTAFIGSDSFTYTATDGTFTNTATVSLTINNPVNAPNYPETVLADHVLTVDAAHGVLSQVTDASGRTPAAAVDVQPSSGTLTLNADGSFTYTPNAGFIGQDSFTYTADDGKYSATGAVTIDVNSPADAKADSYTTTVNIELMVDAAHGVLANDTDANHNPLTAVVVDTTFNGTLVLNTDGSFSYTPNAGFQGFDSFTYKANDGTYDSSVVLVNITVSNPITSLGDSYSVEGGTPLVVDAALGVLANDTDSSGGTLTATIGTLPTSGIVTLSPDGSFTYTPNAGFSGFDSFTYTASDGTATGSSTFVSLFVSNPVATTFDFYSTPANTNLNTDAAHGVLANDTDASGLTLTAAVSSQPAHGTLTLNPDGSFTYIPAAGFAGTDSFTYHASDGAFTSPDESVQISVFSPATAFNDTYTTTLNHALSVDTAHGVLTNDFDSTSGVTLTAIVVAQPSHGTLTLNPDGSFIYTPANGFQGADTFQYKANDGTFDSAPASVFLNVNGPVAGVPDSASTLADTVLTVDAAHGVLSNDTDTAGGTLTAAVVTQPTHGALTLNPDGSFTYTPSAGYIGADIFTYKATDGTFTSNTTLVSIQVNSPVTTQFDSYNTTVGKTMTVDAAHGVLANDSDANGHPLTASIVSQPAHGTVTLNPDGSFSYVPEAGFIGFVSFLYRANDGKYDSDITSAAISVNSPVTGNFDVYGATQGTLLTVDAAHGVLANDTDANSQALTAVLGTTTTNGTLHLNSDGSFTYTPSAGFHGTDQFTYQASDGTYLSSPTTAYITVTGAVHTGIDFYTATYNTLLTVSAANGVLSNDSDANHLPLTVAVVDTAAHGTLTLHADGSFTYQPANNFHGSDQFTYTATDGTDTSNSTTVFITVTGPVNAVADDYTAGVNTPLSVDAAHGVLVNDTDSNSKPLTASIVSQPSHGTVVLHADGSFVYVPGQDFTGFDSFQYSATDGTDTSDPGFVSITVASPVNTVSDSATTPVNTTLTVDAAHGVLANDTDAQSKPLTAAVSIGPAHGNLTLNPDGSFVYVPDHNYTGPDSFDYTATDGTFTSDPTTVFLTVQSPVVALDDTGITQVNTPLHVDAAHGVLANDSDSNTTGQPLTATVVDQPTNGAVTLNPDGSYTYTPTAGFVGYDFFSYTASDGTYTSETAFVSITVNSAAVANDDKYATTKGTTLTVPIAQGVLANDTDAGGHPLTAILVNTTFDGTLTLNPDGSFVYTPNANFHGFDFFDYKVNDGTVDSLSATVTITVNGAVVATDDAYRAKLGSTLDVPVATGLLANDTTSAGQPLTVTLLDAPTKGTLTLNPDGSFTYTPFANAVSGTDFFDYVATDGVNTSNPANVTITLAAPHTGPIAVNDTYATNENVALVTTTNGVLANDDGDGAPLTAVVVAQPTNGTLTFNADGSFTYTPSQDFHGSDSFTYKANNGTADTGIATVTILVNFVNHAPTLAQPADVTVLENAGAQAVNLTGISAGVANESLQTLTITATSDNTSLVPNPTVTYTTGATGTLHFTPAANAFGTATITVTIKDDGGTANGGADTVVKTFKITVTAVNQVPSFTKGANQTPLENAGPQTVAGWATNISAGPANESTQHLTFVAVADQPSLFAVAPAISSTGNLTYQLAANAVGTATITVTLKDDGGTANGGVDTSPAQTFTIVVTPVNQAPTVDAIADVNILENASAKTVNLTGISSGPANEAGQTLTVTATSDNTSVIPNPTVTYTTGATGSLSFTPAANAHGTATITLTIKDNGGTANGGVDTVVKTFVVTVGAVNQSPALDAIADVNILENAGGQTVNLTGISAGPANESTQTLTVTATSDTPGLVANPVVTYNGGAAGSLAFTPVTNANGTATITVTVKDNGGTANGGVDTFVRTFKIHVGAVNQPPTLNPIADVNILENAAAQTVNLTGLSAGPANESAQTLTITATSSNTNLVPNPTVTYTTGATGSLHFTPVANASGSATITVTVKDTGGTATGGVDTITKTFTVNVAFVNHAPSFTKGADQLVAKTAGAQTIAGWATNISAGPANEAAQHLTFQVTTDNPNLFSVAPAISPTGTLTYTLSTTAFGSANVTVTLKDDGGVASGGADTSAPQTFAIRVKANNTGDFDGDGITDPAVFEPSTSTFYLSRSKSGNAAVQFGIGTLYGGHPVNVSADYDGDGIIDPAVFEPSTATFYIARSKLGNEAVQFGIGTKFGGNPTPVPGNYEGDGITDPAVFESSTSTFYISRHNAPNEAVQFGIGTLYGGHPVPVPNLFEGGATTDPAVFEPSTSTFYIARHAAPNEAVQFGIGTLYGGHPVVAPADYDGDGIIDPAVFEPSTSTFYLARTHLGNAAVQFGIGTLYGGHPVVAPADFDGDGRIDPAVFEPSTATFYISRSNLGNEAVQFGIGTKFGGNPVVNAADFDGDGVTDPTVFEPSTSTFYISRSKLGNEAVQFGIGTKFGGHPVPISAPPSPSTTQGSVGTKGLALGAVVSDATPTPASSPATHALVHDVALEHLGNNNTLGSRPRVVNVTDAVNHGITLHDTAIKTIRLMKTRRILG